MIKSLRYAVMVVISFAIIIYLAKKHNNHTLKIKHILFCLIPFLVAGIIGNFPVENLFLEFDTPKEAHSGVGEGNLSDILIGNDSAVVISAEKDKDNNNKRTLYLEKENGKYKAPAFLTNKYHYSVFSESSTVAPSVTALNETDTNNYYIILNAMEIGENSITDNYKNTYKEISVNNSDRYTAYYAYVENINPDDYYVDINGEKISVLFDETEFSLLDKLFMWQNK